MILGLFIKLWYRLSSYLFTIIQMCDPHSISRLFTDAKKILLYSQQDKSFAGFKGLVRALSKLQRNTEGMSRYSVGNREPGLLRTCLEFILKVHSS